MLRSQRDSNLRFLNSVCANRRRHCVGHGNLAGSNLCIASSARCIIVAMRTVLSESPSGRMFESRDRLTTSFGVVGGEDARYLNKLRRLSLLKRKKEIAGRFCSWPGKCAETKSVELGEQLIPASRV